MGGAPLSSQASGDCPPATGRVGAAAPLSAAPTTSSPCVFIDVPSDDGRDDGRWKLAIRHTPHLFAQVAGEAGFE